MNKFYELYDVIFGLRNEYKKSRKDLNNLKKYCSAKSDSVRNFYFYVNKDNKIICRVRKNNSNYYKIKDFVNNYRSISSDIYETGSRKYILDSKLPVGVSHLNYFKSTADNILNSEFSKNIKLKPTEIFPDSILEIEPSCIRFITVSDVNGQIVELKYRAIDDSIVIKIDGKYDPNDLKLIVEDIFKSWIPGNILNDYHKKTINNNIKEKELIVNNVEEINKNEKICYKLYSDNEYNALVRKIKQN